MRRMITSACVFAGLSIVAMGCGSEPARDGQVEDIASAHRVRPVPKAKLRKLDQRGDRPIPGRSGHQVVVVKDELYVSRGVLDDFNTGTNTFREDLYRVDPKPGHRVQVTELRERGNGPGQISQHCAVGDDRRGGSIVSFGGANYIFQGDPNFPPSLVMFDTTYKYRVPTKEWTVVTPATKPPPRAGCHAENYRGDMYMFGGLNRFFQLNNEMWKFDIDAETWTLIPPNGPAPSPRYLGATVIDEQTGNYYLFSGHQFTPGGEATIGDFWVYNIPTNTWRQLPTSVLPLRDEGMLSILRAPHGKKYLVYALGHTSAATRCVGFPLQTTSLREIWAFDPEVETWQKLDVIGQTPGIQFVRGGTIDNKHYLIGGWDDVPDPVNTCKQVFNEDIYELTLDD